MPGATTSHGFDFEEEAEAEEIARLVMRELLQAAEVVEQEVPQMDWQM